MKKQIYLTVLTFVSVIAWGECKSMESQKTPTQTMKNKSMMADAIFRMYDIRGKVGSEMPVDQVYDLTRAIAYYFKQKNPAVTTVAVGADGRIHSPDIKQEVCRALRDSGLDVLFVGVCPSPVLYFSLVTHPVQAGIMITASHNGKEYNGMKICMGKEPVAGDKIQEIKELYKQTKHLQAATRGDYAEAPVITEYIEWMAEHFAALIGMQTPVLVDCGNGAGGTVMPQLIKRMQWPNVQLLYPEVDGNYPNHEADPIVQENMQSCIDAVVEGPYMLGAGLDGDCDRMAPISKSGELVSGDKQLALFAQPILDKHPGASVVFDIKCSSGLSELLTKWGGTPVMSATGHSLIKQNMKKTNAVLGGEFSCHFFFADRYFGYDDGIYALMRLFELLQNSGKTLDELVAIFPKKYSTTEIRIECDDDKKFAIVQEIKQQFMQRSDYQVNDIDGIRASNAYGWGNVRASNTQPALSIRFEADTQEHLSAIKRDFIEALKPYCSLAVLQEKIGE